MILGHAVLPVKTGEEASLDESAFTRAAPIIAGMPDSEVSLWSRAVSFDFYMRVVGLPTVRAEEFRAGKVPFPSVQVSDESILDLMAALLNGAWGRSALTAQVHWVHAPGRVLVLVLGALLAR